MKETRIPFCDELVRAILSGRKTQTRRVIRPQPEVDGNGYLSGAWLQKPFGGILLPKIDDLTMECPYGGIGDCLLGTEAWQHTSPLSYRADYRNMMIQAGIKPSEMDARFAAEKWKSSRFMPKWASRLRLPITEVRVQRLQEISEEDARAEGARCVDRASGREVLFPDASQHIGSWKLHFIDIWERLNAKRGLGWDANPYVWVISFRRIS